MGYYVEEIFRQTRFLFQVIKSVTYAFSGKKVGLPRQIFDFSNFYGTVLAKYLRSIKK